LSILWFHRIDPSTDLPSLGRHQLVTPLSPPNWGEGRTDIPGIWFAGGGRKKPPVLIEISIAKESPPIRVVGEGKE